MLNMGILLPNYKGNIISQWKDPYPIGSMFLVYFDHHICLILRVNHVGKYTSHSSHGSYGVWKTTRIPWTLPRLLAFGVVPQEEPEEPTVAGATCRLPGVSGWVFFLKWLTKKTIRKQWLGGGLKYLFIFTPIIWWRFPIWRSYFSDGLKPPTRKRWRIQPNIVCDGLKFMFLEVPKGMKYVPCRVWCVYKVQFK